MKVLTYRMAQNVGGVKLWQNHSTRVMEGKILAN